MLHESRSERAILLIDMINDFVHPQGTRYLAAMEEVIPFIMGELQYFRERMRPVIFCNTLLAKDSSYAALGSFGAKVIQSLSPRTGEICINKTRPNAFFGTELASILHGLKVNKITLVGPLSHTSILVTAASALDHGFCVVVPETCVCSTNEADNLASLRLLNGWLKDEQISVVANSNEVAAS